MANRLKIMVFLHGTTIMHRGALKRSRKERVQQVREREASVRDFAAYIPVGDAVNKLRYWDEQGADILYLSSHKRLIHVEQDRIILRIYHFPNGIITFRQPGEQYLQVIARSLPDVLVEDDCESIGGAAQIIYPRLPAELQARITSIVVKEFGGVDHLPNDVLMLRNCHKP